VDNIINSIAFAELVMFIEYTHMKEDITPTLKVLDLACLYNEFLLIVKCTFLD